MLFQTVILLEIIGDTLRVVGTNEEMVSASIAASESFLSSIENAICSNDSQEVTKVWLTSDMSFSYLIKEGETPAQFFDRVGWTVIPPVSIGAKTYTYLGVRSTKHLRLNGCTVPRNNSGPNSAVTASIPSSTGSSQDNFSSHDTTKHSPSLREALGAIIIGCILFPIVMVFLILLAAVIFDFNVGDLTVIALISIPVGGVIGYGIFYWWYRWTQ